MKVVFQKDVRILPLSPNETAKTFLRKVQNDFGKGKVAEFSNRVLESDDDFDDLYSLAQQSQRVGKTLRVNIHKEKS